MSKTFTIEVADEIAERIERVADKAREKLGGRTLFTSEVVEQLVAHGLVSSETQRGDIMGDGRRVADLTLRELLQASGIADAALARQRQIEAAETQQKTAAKVQEVFADVQTLAMMKPTDRIRTAEQFDNLCDAMKNGIGPGRALTVMWAVVDDAETVAPTVN